MKNQPHLPTSEDYDPSDYYEDYDLFDKNHRKITINWRLFMSFVRVIYIIDTTVTVISIITNALHLIILTRKSMRNNFVNIIMIGICFCDLLMLSLATFLVFGDSISGLDECTTSESLVAIYVDWVIMILFDITRRTSTYLGLFMAFLRLLVVTFPMSEIMKSLTKSVSAVVLVISVTTVCAIWDCSYWMQYSIRNLKGKREAPSNNYTKLKPMSSKNKRKLRKQELLSRLLNNALEFDPEFEIDTKNLKIGEELGGGNFGIVHKAKLYCLNLKTKTNSITVAVKRAKDSQDSIQQKMIFDELKVMCAIGRHQNVLTLLGGVTVNPSDVMIISEFADHGSLLEFLKKFQNENAFNDQLLYTDQQSGHKLKTGYTTSIEINDCMESLSTVDLVSFAYQIANGMEFLAGIPCVHRDLAIRNVFLMSHKIIRIGDFGLTRKHQNKEYYRIASPDIPLPANWLAPENLEDFKFTEQSDIWSFGVCLYELFTLGKTPYKDVKDMSVLSYLKSGARLREPEYCHPKIYEFMNLCWATHPLFRPNFKMCTAFFKEHLSNIDIPAYNHLEEKLERECQYQNELINWIRTTET